MHAVPSQTEPAKRVRRKSEHAISDLALLFVCRPDRALSIGWWRLLGKKVRARNRLESALAKLPAAERRRLARLGREDAKIVAAARVEGRAASFGIHLHIADTDRPDAVRRALSGIARQSDEAASVFITREPDAPQVPDDSEPASTRIEGLVLALGMACEAGCDWLIPTTCDILLPKHAVAAFGAHVLGLEDAPDTVLLYGDEEEIGHVGSRARSWLKPEWDSRMALSQDYVSASCALAVAPAMTVAHESAATPPINLYEIVLKLAVIGRVHHLNRITSRTAEHSWKARGSQTLAAVERFAGRHAASVASGPFGTVDLRWPLPDPAPSVNVIVATRDRVELLRTCVEGVLHATDYPDLEVIIADNESVEPETLAYMDKVAADPRVSVVRWPHLFNYSAINNFAASHARGQYLCLLNNDIEVIEPDWLTSLVREAMQPGVGAVGARLYYPDRSIQHAGVAIGIGNAAGHAHRGLPEGEPGYYAQALIARGASAVTGACLLVSKRNFDAVGGLDEEQFAVAYNDVDLCLKLQSQGLTNIYTPLATLIHHESKSRGNDFAPERLEQYLQELAALKKRWNTEEFVDPWHHPLLDRQSETYAADE